MNKNFKVHHSVMVSEVLQGLITDNDGVYIDATFGRGGHSRAILALLASNARLIALDRDQDAINCAKKLSDEDKRFSFFSTSFSFLPEILDKLGLKGKISGIVADLGVSSPQLDDAERGFSFMKDGPLDMRMDKSKGITAARWLAETKLDDMIMAFREYGEERFSDRVARKIVEVRDKDEIINTFKLVDIIKSVIPARAYTKAHPATRIFQAIRIAVNEEIKELEKLLLFAPDLLKINGRLAIITFHSLEARTVKKATAFSRELKEEDFYYENFINPIHRSYLPEAQTLKSSPRLYRMRRVKVSNSEIADNRRARSAILRIFENRIDI